MSEERRKKIEEANVTEWDEYGQGYNGYTLVVCVCGLVRPDGDFSDHKCPCDKREDNYDDYMDMNSV